MTLAQFGSLFYLTYAVFDWDFCEPIAYLLDLSIEAAAIFLFIRSGSEFGQEYFYQKAYDKSFLKRITKVSSNLPQDLLNLQRRVAIVKK